MSAGQPTRAQKFAFPGREKKIQAAISDRRSGRFPLQCHLRSDVLSLASEEASVAGRRVTP